MRSHGQVRQNVSHPTLVMSALNSARGQSGARVGPGGPSGIPLGVGALAVEEATVAGEAGVAAVEYMLSLMLQLLRAVR